MGLSPDLGPNPEFSTRLATSFAPGAHTVTATGAAGGSSVTVRVWRSETEVVNGPEFAITDELQMPVITARVRIIGPVTATFREWRCSVFFSTVDGVVCPNAPLGVINDDLKLTQEGGIVDPDITIQLAVVGIIRIEGRELAQFHLKALRKDVICEVIHGSEENIEKALSFVENPTIVSELKSQE